MTITFVKDMAERVVASILVGVGAAVKALVARKIGDPESASLSPDV